ncbi:MAG: hypothetical protein PQJ60_01155 [Spirochaetales bacterium]|nr:hypothetical protein [Spirochaetales bacterium]
MQENPAMHKILENLKPGVISLHGFLGKDKRDLDTIIEHDEGELTRLGITQEQIAVKLEEIRDKAMEGLGTYVKLNDTYMAKADSIRGKMPCPFDHAGLYGKTVITIQNIKTDEEMIYTDLGIHLIREHGFFQGKGSLFRLEPEHMADLLKECC